MTTNRRKFLKTSSAVTLGALPSLIYRGADASEFPSSRADGKILVVVQMSGGNDGINTVVPFGDGGYAKHRDKLQLPTKRLIKINDSTAFHPSMRGASDLLEAGKLAIIQGVGYPNPSRSHEVSMAIWQSATIGDETAVRTHGWLGKAMDASHDGSTSSSANDPHMILIGDESQPLAIQSRRSTAITLSNLTDLQLKSPLGSTIDKPKVNRDSDELFRFVEQTMGNATAAAATLETTIEQGATTDVTYPSSRLGQRLQSVSTLIKSGFETPVYYTIQPGYDTHSAQLPTHSRLLREFSGAIKAFLSDLEAAGLSDRVCVLGFSEFGRRVEENGSEGTDHGTSGPVFLFGDQTRSGLIGKAPNLLELVKGDLQMSVDFRSVFQEVTTDWLGVKGDAIGGTRERLGLFDT